jgi:hypothetical protein
MSEDRLEKALQAMKSEEATPEQLAEARARVWEKLENPGTALCSEFRTQFRDYLDGRLSANRRLLVEDHLGRCPACRARLAEEKGERNIIPMPIRRVARWPKWGTWAAAAAVLLVALYVTRDGIDSLLAPRGPRATVASLTGGLYMIQGGTLNTGSAIGENAVVRTGPSARAVLRLYDGSTVDVNERTELSLHGAWSGQSIRLQRGDIIVHAAKQRRGHLRVETRDSVASVRGTIFAVSAGFNGSLVSVVEGSVAVSQPGSEVLLKPGEQSTTNPGMTSSVQEAVAWSPDAETYLQILGSLARIDKQMAAIPTPLLRTQSTLLQYVPANMAVYGAVPNISGTIDQAMGLAEQQSAENPAFNQWWNSGPGGELKKLIGRVQTVAPWLGDEIVYGVCMNRTGTTPVIPIILAEVRQGKRAELQAALNNLGLQIAGSPSYQLSDTLLAASNSAENLQWLLGNMGQSAGSPFAREIAARYQDGAAWLLGIDMDSVIATRAASNQLVSASQIKNVFLEQRRPQGIEENEVSVSFKGPRTGLASMLASTGSGGAAEYLSTDSIIAVYASTREPQQLFEEITTQLSQFSPVFRNNLADAEAKMGISFSNDLARAFGTESAFAIQGISTTGPVWTMAVLVNDPTTLDNTIRKLMNSINGVLEREGKAERLAIEQETVDGRTWTTLKLSQQPFAFTWAYDRGYMVAGSDRGVASQAIATRNGGSPLVWSPAFQQQLSSSAGLHPSGFVWLNTKGALSSFASLVQNPVIQKLLAERDPILVTFSGTMEQIRAVSRTRLSGMVVNLLMMQGMSGTRAGSRPANTQSGTY